MSAPEGSAPARLVLTTCANEAAAQGLARTLVGEGLAACANLVPGVRSIYRWKGAVEEAGEVLVLLKTTPAACPALAARIAELHDYDVPEVVVLDVAGGAASYLAWLGESVVPPAPPAPRGAG